MQIITAEEAASLVRDGDTVLISGSGGGHAVPDALYHLDEHRRRW
jgi:propionate CoA-transferase